jgi:hypothetical protein
MDTGTGIWSNLTALRSLGAWLQWTSIALVFLSGLLQVGKYLVDRRKKTLSSAAQAELINPAAQPIRTATVTVDLTVESNDQVNTTYMDRGGYVAFGRGPDALLVMADTESRARQTGQGEVQWRGVFNMDATNSAVGKPVRFLRESEYLQVGFQLLPAKSKIKKGLAVVTINSAVRLEIPIPEQNMEDDKIMVRALAQFLDVLR